MKCCLVISTLVAAVAAQGVLPPVVNNGDTLYRDEVPRRIRPADKPKVENPEDYDVYFDPNLNYNGPLVAAPILEPIQPARPKFVPKPFVPRERKQVKKLQPCRTGAVHGPRGQLRHE
ncbi:uncharacterized protein LOC119100355 [Pollicipes pollicipes]|uniref:uncharacterized protein LOC119100355 n=1 Tax=Pollicipes pollicipes TaxID=41117 RepID=UPI0018854D47|nr:uncharacterized protein LOC119100355 [Pollicipes pollicipes]